MLFFRHLTLDKLRFYLSGENQVAAGLYELLFTSTLQVAFRSLDPDVKRPPVVLPPEKCLFQVGFEEDEGLLPLAAQSFVGYRLLTELLSFPDKFLFVDLGGWRWVSGAQFGKNVEVLVFLSRTHDNLEQGIDAQTFRLFCTPVINLFEKSAEPIALTQRQYDYRVVPARTQPLATEIYSVDAVSCFDPVQRRLAEYQPFFSFAHDQNRDNQKAFWYASRRASPIEGDGGTEVYLNLVDLNFHPRQPAEAVLDVRTTCTNRDLPGRFQRAGHELFLEPGGAARQGPIRCLTAPSPALRPPLRRGAHWRLLSQLAINHATLTDPDEGREVLRELLRLCDFTDPEAGQQQLALVNRHMIEGITALSSRTVLGRARTARTMGLCRGIEFTLQLDENKYIGTGAFLFASVLERFLGYSAALNSFSQLVAQTTQGEGYLKKWPPRAAERQLL
jgi:type VI secretion system protein ImpG